jgi:MSHA biogenesis protein MshM
LVLGEPGTGKSVLKQTLLHHDPKRLITPVVNRTLHTYHNTLRILCEAFQIEFEGRDHRCERLLVQEAFKIHRAGKMLVPIIDDAHLMPSDCLRKLRLLCEDFPHSHNLVLIGQPPLLQSLALSINEEIRSRVTYSVVLPRLSPEAVEAFVLGQLDRAGLGHNTFTAEALALIVRSGEGLLRRTRNLCLSSLIEAVRDQIRVIDLKTSQPCAHPTPLEEKTVTNPSPKPSAAAAPRWTRDQIRAARVVPLCRCSNNAVCLCANGTPTTLSWPAIPASSSRTATGAGPNATWPATPSTSACSVLGLSFHDAMRALLHA